jgi:uncharacterized membrane protein
MSVPRDPILFEAVSTPPATLSARGMRWLCALAAVAAAVPAVVFTLLGAWPVLGFIGVEVALVLGLVAMLRRQSRAKVERIMLVHGKLVIHRNDGRGGRDSTELDAYWTRLSLEEPAGGGAVLQASARGRSVEVGRFLAPAEKRDLADALEAALRSYRNPVFDNDVLKRS